MAPQKYTELLEKSVQMEYKKANPQIAKNIKSSHKQIVANLDLQDRVYRTTEREPFITIKDHKQNFQPKHKMQVN